MDDVTPNEELKKLKSQLSRLKLEAKLRRNLASEIEKQKQIALAARSVAQEKTKELEVLSSQLAKYLSPQLYHSIFSGEKLVNIASSKKPLTIFFSDLVGFTTLSDNLDSDDLTNMLNFYLTEMSNIALEYGGTIDKYIGDAVMVFFGDPHSLGIATDAQNCVSMAMKMQSRMAELTDQWQVQFGLLAPLEMRIGINSGICTVGNFGSESRLDYTVIGGEVNLASRLETLCHPGRVLLSENTFQLVQDAIICRDTGVVRVKGIESEIVTYEVSDQATAMAPVSVG
jgi:class 3 adenylate cyclase